MERTLEIILPYISYTDQLHLAQTCSRFEDIISRKSSFYLNRLQRNLKKNSNLARKYENRANWTFYRALVWIFEEIDSEIEKSEISGEMILARAEWLGEKILKFGLGYFCKSNLFQRETDHVLVNLEPDWSIEIELINSPSLTGQAGQAEIVHEIKINELSTSRYNFQNWSLILPRQVSKAGFGLFTSYFEPIEGERGRRRILKFPVVRLL